MITPSAFQEIASGRQRGAKAAVLRTLLGAAALPYGWAVQVRNLCYDRRWAAGDRAGVPVVSVGNLTTGGAGKTPLVEWIARRLQSRGLPLAILSRGYGAAPGEANDEARELELALPDVPHLQSPDRRASAKRAIDQHGAAALVLDDGFQHRRLARDLDIVLLDASQPFGFDRLLPRGTLREPPTGLRRADVVILSRADMLQPAEREAVRQRARELAPSAIWCEVKHAPTRLLRLDGAAADLTTLEGQSAAAFCAIGNPAGFRHTLQSLGCRVVQFREFADHHAFTAEDASELISGAGTAGAKLILCTRKDMVKLAPAQWTKSHAPLLAVEVGMHFLRGQEELEQAIDRATLRSTDAPSTWRHTTAQHTASTH